MLSSNKQIKRISTLGEQLLSYTHCSKDYERTLCNYGLKDAFGLDVKMNHMEIHILTAIHETPGIAAQDLASKFFRTKSAISQITKFLIKEGLIIKIKNPQNARINNLYVTEIGRVACNNHADHENAIFEKLLPVFKDYSEQDFEKIYKAIEAIRKCL